MEVGKLNEILASIRSNGIITANDLMDLSHGELAFILSTIITELQHIKRTIGASSSQA